MSLKHKTLRHRKLKRKSLSEEEKPNKRQKLSSTSEKSSISIGESTTDYQFNEKNRIKLSKEEIKKYCTENDSFLKELDALKLKYANLNSPVIDILTYIMALYDLNDFDSVFQLGILVRKMAKDKLKELDELIDETD